MEQWNSGTVEQWNGIVESLWWNGGIVEWATMINDPYHTNLFAHAHYAAQSQKGEREECVDREAKATEHMLIV